MAPPWSQSELAGADGGSRGGGSPMGAGGNSRARGAALASCGSGLRAELPCGDMPLGAPDHDAAVDEGGSATPEASMRLGAAGNVVGLLYCAYSG